MRTYYNTHTHVFNEACVPPSFYGRSLTRLIDRITLFPSVRDVFVSLVRAINPFNVMDKGNRLANMIMKVTHDSQEEVWEEMLAQYSEYPNMKFVTLSIDFDFMQAGESLINYHTQLYELTILKNKYADKLLPFVCADPRRYQGEKLTEFIKLYIEKKGFAGIKLYPALGYFPFDPSLFHLFDYAEKNGIPIITHCDTGGVYYRGELTSRHLKPQHMIFQSDARIKNVKNHLIGTRVDYHPVTEFKEDSLYKFKNNFSNPYHFREVLNIFPDLKICFAHFGGAEEIKKFQDRMTPSRLDYFFGKEEFIEETIKGRGSETWFEEIAYLMRAFPNVYTDISYTLHDTRVQKTLKNVIQHSDYQSRILFGTDYFLVSREKEEAQLVAEFRNLIDSSQEEPVFFNRIASDNPIEFLKRTTKTTI